MKENRTFVLQSIGWRENVLDKDSVSEDSRFKIGRYEVVRSVFKKRDRKDEELKKWFVSYSVFKNSKYGDIRYLPEIYWEGEPLSKEDRFVINTTSYGALGVEEIEKVIDGYQEAVEVVKILTKNFC